MLILGPFSLAAAPSLESHSGCDIRPAFVTIVSLLRYNQM
jgi:hypothetical protein